MAEILRGKPVADALLEQLHARLEELQQKGTRPCLAVLRLGEEAGQLAYERSVQKRAAALGVAVRLMALPEESSTQQVLDAVDAVNADAGIHGCLLLRPLPAQVDEHAACSRLSPEKDVDGITDASLTALLTGRGAGFCPCTPEACMELLDYYKIPLRGARVILIGRSLVVGKPLALRLLARDATVTLCHSRTEDLPAVCREAEILIAAAGCARLVGTDAVSERQILIDVGVNDAGDGTLCGDVDFTAVEPLVAAATPVPGGVGAVTTAVLMKHVVLAAERQLSGAAEDQRRK